MTEAPTAEALKLPALARDVHAPLSFRLEDKVIRLTFPASSEEPVERFFGQEVLSHTKEAVRLERVKRGAMPLLFNHNWDDPIGIVDTARLEDGRLVVDAHLFETARALEVGQMLTGGLRNVSLGYRLHVVEEDKKRNVFTATDWEPFEVSIVTIPADPTVGIGRQVGGEELEVRMVRASPAAGPAESRKEPHMEVKDAPAGGAAETERLRIIALQEMCATHKIDETTRNKWIHEGVSLESAAQKVLDVIAERAKLGIKDHPAHLGLTDAEKARFNMVRAINAVVSKDWSKAGFEAEVSRATAQRMGKNLSEFSFLVPIDIQQRTTLQVGTGANGGYTVGTDLQSGSFIDLLRNRSVSLRMGARFLSGLVGAVAIPKGATSGSVGWIGELGTATASELTLTQLTMSPKHIAGFQQISRQLLLQSTPDIEMLVNADLAAAIALGLDTAVLAGTSTDSSQPLGIRYTSGLGTANPTSGTAVTYGDMIRFQSTVATSNAMFPAFGYVCHPTIAAILMGKPRFTNSDTPIWGGNILDGLMVGARAMSSVQITSGTMLAGDFSQVIIGEWGSLEVETNPYQNFQAGIVGVRAMYSVDVAVRYGAAFAIGTGITG
jgi:HK97 family phage major capsid protein/HK97 family phage prohead protease